MLTGWYTYHPQHLMLNQKYYLSVRELERFTGIIREFILKAWLINNPVSLTFVDRYFTEQKIDVDYLTRLSIDAVPQISRLLNVQDPDIVLRVNTYLNKVKSSLDKPRHWQEFNWAEYRVKKLLSTLE